LAQRASTKEKEELVRIWRVASRPLRLDLESKWFIKERVWL